MSGEWKSIERYEGFYEVSNLGKVRSVERVVNNNKGGRGSIRRLSGVELKPSLAGKNRDYHYVTLHRIGVTESMAVHVLVAKAFIPNPDGLPEVNHKSGDKNDNADGNLEWTTHIGNCRHAILNGLASSLIGEKNICAKLTEQEVIRIRDLFAGGMSQKAIADSSGVPFANVHSIVRQEKLDAYMSEPIKDDMTAAQREAIQKAWDLLCEHFDRVLLVIDFDIDTETTRKQGHEGFWHGGALSAVGMARFAEDRILNDGQQAKSNEPEF